ncbi:MAG: hypothetical protein KKG75_01120 [Nanoarchaeota archaeon]|nr:hypothetical protein [Nanoarchaeota archaeon]
MKYAVIISKKDPASLNIFEHLKKLNFPEKDIYIIQEKSIYSDNLNQKINADFFIFATKHKSSSLKKTLSVHNPGNWSKAELGGRDSTLPPSKASILKLAYLELKKNNNLDYEVSGEVTHHGPFLNKPSLFIEIGSSKLQWKDVEAAKVIAKTINSIVSTTNLEKYKTAIGFGGGHYMPSFNKVLERTEYSLAYVCPKHQLQNLNKEIIEQAIKNSVEPVEAFLVEWKGLGAYKEKVQNLLEEFNIPIIRIKKLLKK